MGQRAVRATAAAVTVVTVVTALAGCGRLETRRHAFPDSLYEPTPSTGASATPSATPSAAAGTGNPPAATAPRATTPGTGTGAPGEPYADLTAAQLLQKAEEAASEVRTVRVVAAFSEDGEQSSLDLRYDLDTADVVGSIEAEGHTVEILRRGDDSWFKAEAAYWRASGAPADTARQIGGKYLHVSSDHKAFGEFEQLAGIADPGSVLEALTKPRRQAPVVAAGGTQIPVAGYTGGDPTMVYLSVELGLVPVRVVDPGSGSAVDYREIDKPVVVPTPPSSQVVDIEELSADVRLPTA
ncbi:hypothetical protein [Streptodolium elevatio]|uniref:Lipoprotein n=1 Tax=Streptodolium elevatio TaxID=3157996 RepID=A0ABV3DIF3_9ACTN